MAALGPVDLGELSGLASLDERFLAEAGLLGEQDEAESAGGTWQAALDFAAKSDDGGAGAGALDQAMEFEALPVQLRCIASRRGRRGRAAATVVPRSAVAAGGCGSVRPCPIGGWPLGGPKRPHRPQHGARGGGACCSSSHRST